MIYPISSQIKGHENQYPYSFSIVLTARVFEDKRESLKLFNLLNPNYIKLPIFISFIALIIAIIIFIINFTRFQIIQIWKPIDLLTEFLKMSLQQDQSCRTLTTQNDREVMKSQPSQFRITSQKRQTKIMYPQTPNSPETIQSQNDSFAIKSPNQNQVSKIISLKDRLITDSPVSQFKSFRLSLFTEQIEQEEESPIKEVALESQRTIMTNNKASQFYITKSKNMIYSSIPNRQHEEQDEQIYHKEETETKKILKGLKPMFLEMKVIKKAFQDLEFVINYSIQSSQISSQDSINTFFHFSKAKSLFLRLNNQTGLSRCYFNLGLIHLLKYEYSLSSEYFQSALQINLNILGIDCLAQLNQKFLQGQGQDGRDQLIIFTKRIFSLAYSYKCAAFQQIFIEENQSNDNNFNLFQTLESYKMYTNEKSKSDFQQQNIQYLLKESLNLFKQVEKIIQNNDEDFSDAFKIFLFSEITEILIEISQKQDNFTNYLDKISFLFIKNNISIYSSEQDNSGQIFRKKKQFQILNTKLIIFEAFKSKQMFLIGLIELAKKKKLQAIEYLTQSLEVSTHYDHFQKLRTIQILAKIFKEYSLNQDFLDEEYINIESNFTIDLTILLELDMTFRQYNFLSIINTLKKFDFLKKTDRFQIIVFDKQISQFMPYTIIQGNEHWSVILDSLQELRNQFFLYQEKQQQQIYLNQALEQSLEYIYELNSLEIISSISQKQIKRCEIKEFKSKNKCYQNTNNNYFNQKKRKKILLLLSNGDVFNFKHITKQKELETQCLIIYHLKDQIQYDQKQYQSLNLKYELLQNQNDLINKLTKLRFNQNFDSQSVFLTILNSF